MWLPLDVLKTGVFLGKAESKSLLSYATLNLLSIQVIVVSPSLVFTFFWVSIISLKILKLSLFKMSALLKDASDKFS